MAQHKSNFVLFLVAFLLTVALPHFAFSQDSGKAAISSTNTTPTTVPPNTDPNKKTSAVSSVTNIVEPTFLESFPHLREHLYQEPSSDFYFGFAVAPVGLLKNRMLFMMNFFQSHRITTRWDWEILSTSFGITSARPASAQSYHFLFRTSPKYRLTETISIGVVAGLEYVSFPKVQAFLNKNSWATPMEDFSSRGYIYGVAVSEIFGMKTGNPFRVSQILYQQTYSTEKSTDDWKYVYSDNDFNKDQDPIKAGPVFLLELGYMF